jgi:hypothetical protein
MSTASPVSAVLRRVLENPAGGVTGLVDALLSVCREHDLQLDWQAGRCRIRPAGGMWEEVADVPLRKSVFRAILARIAALCNERTPNSASPYGGQGELAVGPEPTAVLKIAFANTPAEQRLELTTEKEPAGLGQQPRNADRGVAERGAPGAGVLTPPTAETNQPEG